ncbi:DUF1697 domain-containing protein [Sphingosinicella sp. CPCC 101087]|uniref:DUF1697 domain-containing protein n=1 Tax=Sphingosinicella sp. CPCC 101087 TaxID=2497754 RepID=UPI00197EBF95|nr:DUF1697 domain-containing protein [Sphingosinicella sp. CPCC 101087]
MALLRGINVGGRSLPMADLRALCAELGLADIATYIQSGNIVFSARERPEAVAAELEAAIERRFAMKVPTVVRTAGEWQGIVAANPFPDAAREAPNWLLLMVGKTAPPQNIEGAMEATGAAGERVRRAAGILWIHYPAGIGPSKLVWPKTFAGEPFVATTRNYRTAMKLLDMLGA